MIGTLIFADIPLATLGADDPFWGWSDQCKPGLIWNKVPPISDVWQKQGVTQSTWSKQAPNVEDHKKC